MRALITGITGQDGSYLAELLLEKGYEVFGLVRRSSTPNTRNIDHLKNKIRLIEGDVTDPASLDNALISSWPHELYNLAAQSHVGTSFTNPYVTLQTNAIGVLNVMQAIIKLDSDIRLYQASTSEMFGNQSAPLNENSHMLPRSPYGCAKLCAHHLVRNFREQGFFGSSGILFNHESPRRGENFVTRKITRGVADIYLGNSSLIKLFGTHQKRDWGHARDYVRAMWLMLQQDRPDDFVIGTGVTHSIEDILEIAFNEVGIYSYNGYVSVSPCEERPTDINALCAEASKAKMVLGWSPSISFEQMIKEMVESDLCSK